MSGRICPGTGRFCCDDLCTSSCLVNGGPVESECLSCGQPIGYCDCDDDEEYPMTNPLTDEVTDKAIELLPCPFCGSSDVSIVANGKAFGGMHSGEQVFTIGCYRCSASFPGMYEEHGRKCLAEKWNTRAKAKVEAIRHGFTDAEIQRASDAYVKTLISASGSHSEQINTAMRAAIAALNPCGFCRDGWPTYEFQGKSWHSVPEPVAQVPCFADYKETP